MTTGHHGRGQVAQSEADMEGRCTWDEVMRFTCSETHSGYSVEGGSEGIQDGTGRPAGGS